MCLLMPTWLPWASWLMILHLHLVRELISLKDTACKTRSFVLAPFAPVDAHMAALGFMADDASLAPGKRAHESLRTLLLAIAEALLLK